MWFYTGYLFIDKICHVSCSIEIAYEIYTVTCIMWFYTGYSFIGKICHVSCSIEIAFEI